VLLEDWPLNESVEKLVAVFGGFIMLALNGFVPVTLRSTCNPALGTVGEKVCDGVEGMVGKIATGDPADEGVYPPNPAPVHSGAIGC